MLRLQGLRCQLTHLLKSAGALIMLLATCGITATVAQAQTRLSPETALYARVRTLSNGEQVASVTAFNGGNHIDIYASGNGGASFSRVGGIYDSQFASGLCCGTIFELSRQIGSLPAGTLLWAGSVGQDAANRRMRIKVYRSGDRGRNWSFLSEFISPNTGGLWEPEFLIANDGALVMLYSDETNGAHSQRLMKVRSYNGVNWQNFENLVASTIQADRPGMAVVSRLNNGSRLMTYELCGPANCTAFYKTSADGWNWGDSREVGSAIRLADGRYFEHAPYHTLLPNGTILLVGQVLHNANGSIASGNGTTIFKSANGNPAGPWTTINAPVGVPGAYDNYCPNYSSPLLALSNSSVLQFASRWEGDRCIMFYNRGPTN